MTATGIKIPTIDVKSYMPDYLKEKTLKTVKIGNPEELSNKVDYVLEDKGFLKGAKDV